MKKAVLSVVFIGLITWSGIFGSEAPTLGEIELRSGTIKRPIKW